MAAQSMSAHAPYRHRLSMQRSSRSRSDLAPVTNRVCRNRNVRVFAVRHPRGASCHRCGQCCCAAASLLGRLSLPASGLLRRALAGSLAQIRSKLAEPLSRARPGQGSGADFGYRKDLESRVVLKELLGAGQYGRVFAAEDRQSGVPYAVKSIPKSIPGLDPRTLANYRDKIRREVDTQIALGRSLNIVYLYDAFEDDKFVHLLLERCTGGNLWARRDIVEGHFDEAKAAEVVRVVLRTIAQCHAKGVAFRDVKPENFMYSSPDPAAPLKLSDFGLAVPFHEGQKLTERCGTIYYVAPEVIAMSYGKEADLWSAGVVAYQLLSGRLPFTDKVNDRPVNKEIWHSILFDDVDLETSPWDTISPLAKDLVRRLLERDVRKRISAADAAQHVWVREGGVTGAGALDGTVIARLQRFGTSNALQQTALRMMAKGLDELERRSSGGLSADLAAIENMFDKMDAKREGKVPRAAVEARLKADGYALTEEEWAQMLAQMDPGNSGAITRDGFIASLVDWNSEADRVGAEWTELARQAYQAFLERARSGGGASSSGEKGIALDDVLDEVCLLDDDGGTVCRAAVQDVLREADANRDGHVSFDEWLRLVAPLKGDDLGKYDRRMRGAAAAAGGAEGGGKGGDGEAAAAAR